MPSKKRVAIPKDPKKESLFKELASILEQQGYQVRREKLKAGPGWKAISGSCRAQTQKFIFVDPRMPQDDQILFLRARAETLGVGLPLVETKEAE